MELVTLVRAHLSRIGSSRGGFFASKEAHVIREVVDDSVETMRQLVILVAGEYGEELEDVTLDRGSRPGQNRFSFNVPSGNTWYSQPYAECEVFPALKVGSRYFKLEEIKRQT